MDWLHYDILSLVRREAIKGVTHRLLGYSGSLQRTYESVFQKGCDAEAFRKAYRRLHGADLEPMVNEDSSHGDCKRENRVR
jgi:hypothetical protein